MRYWLFLPMFMCRSVCQSVCLSRGLKWKWCMQCKPYAVYAGSFSTAFAKCHWPLVFVNEHNIFGVFCWFTVLRGCAVHWSKAGVWHTNWYRSTARVLPQFSASCPAASVGHHQSAAAHSAARWRTRLGPLRSAFVTVSLSEFNCWAEDDER